MANVNSELKIDDDYVKAQANLIEAWAGDLQEGIDKYISILNNIRSDAIMEGTTASALTDFIAYVGELRNIVNNMGAEAKGMCLAFLSEVDKADSFLY